MAVPHLFCAVLRLAHKIFQDLAPQVGVPATRCIPQEHAGPCQASIVIVCHVHLQQNMCDMGFLLSTAYQGQASEGSAVRLSCVQH